MAIEIVEIKDISPNKVHAIVNHCGQVFEANIVGEVEKITCAIGQKVAVEIDYEHLSGWRKIDNYTDELSCICKAPDIPNIVIRGRVYNQIILDDEKFIFDIYLQQGPEFVAVDSRELGDTVPGIGDGVELQISGINFYPVEL